MSDDPRTTTRLLNRLGKGDPTAAEELAPLVYAELHRLAERHMGGRNHGQLLQPTALVNEAWMRLAQQQELEFAGRDPFYALASRVMRSVLVDQARARKAQKRGGAWRRVTLLDEEPGAPDAELDVLALEEALRRLEEMDPELHELVELRFFAGLKHPDIARIQGVALRTVERNWRLARAWLHGELSR
jgi:RNA polymerase sigma factor (TIGR02999 family)